ncbi:unnamed protein product [Heligmosomoides polygyrus]|uniref:CCHC-type domain-containing protein n=1 Tax=Heligmosomoides polygyrus TaxID=6339 RepID=A0A183FT75_HELPZ|nr:unnamed protein product [Heligmosomoides polygyrus]
MVDRVARPDVETVSHLWRSQGVARTSTTHPNLEDRVWPGSDNEVGREKWIPDAGHRGIQGSRGERSGSSSPQRSNATAQQTRCFNCEGFGQFSRQCPSPRAQRHELAVMLRLSLCRRGCAHVNPQMSSLGFRQENRSEVHHLVSLEACKLMIQHHKCEYDTLEAVGTSWSTSNALSVEWPSAPFGCCVEHYLSVTNCTLINTVIHMRHGSDSPDSPVGNLGNCVYASGSCTLADGSALLWVPTQEESCKFVPIAKMKVTLRNLLCDGAITAQECRTAGPTWSCPTRAMPTSRVPRAATPQVGVVTSNQLAAQLLAVEGSVASTKPIALRHLLNRVDLAASYLGSGVVQIHRCITAPAHNYRLVPFNGSCFSKPLVELTLPSGAAFDSFIDPVTRIVSQAASPIDCSAVPFFFFSIPGGYIKFEPSQGASVRVAGSSLHAIDLPDSFNSSTFTLSLTIFHNLVLTNLSELVQDHQWQELWSSVDQERLSQFHAHFSTPAAGSQHPASSFSFWSFLLGSWSWFDVWDSEGRYRGLLFHVFPGRFAQSYRSDSFIFISSPSPPGSPPPLAITAHQTRSREDLDWRQMDDLTLQLTRLEIDSTSTWPPRVSVTPVKVLALMNHKQFFVVTFSAGNISTSIGMPGIPIRILGCATLHFELGSVAIDHPVNFTEAACVSSSADSYNIILGNDLLAKLPPWSINYANRTFSMAEHSTQILCVAPPSNECSSEEPIAVRVLETTVLPPSTETCVRCRADIEDQHTLMLTAQADSLGERSLMVTSAVFNSNSTLLLVTNPSSRPETLYKMQHISSAVKIFESASGTFLPTSPQQSKPKKAHMNRVKPCFELSGPVFTSPWQPELEQFALTAADASEVSMTGYAHDKAWSVPGPSFVFLFVAVRTELEPMEPERPADPGKCDFSSSQPCDGSLQDLVDDVETPMDTSDDGALEQPPPEPARLALRLYFSNTTFTFVERYFSLLISVKDFVWVYDVKPTLKAATDPTRVLRASRIPRTTAPLDLNTVLKTLGDVYRDRLSAEDREASCILHIAAMESRR